MENSLSGIVALDYYITIAVYIILMALAYTVVRYALKVRESRKKYRD